MWVGGHEPGGFCLWILEAKMQSELLHETNDIARCFAQEAIHDQELKNCGGFSVCWPCIKASIHPDFLG